MAQPKPRPTMEHGHRVMPQYSGEHAVIGDSRPNPRTRRGVSPDDHPGKTKFVDEVMERYRKAREEE